MTINFNVPGKKRKQLADVIAAWLGHPALYAGAPTFAYKVGLHTIDRNGALEIVGLEEETIERLLQHLYDEGFEYETPVAKERIADGANTDETTLTIQIPAEAMSDTAMHNLYVLLEVKASLIKKALGINELRVDKKDESIGFPWFSTELSPEEVKAYTHFISALCEMASTQSRINTKEKAADNEKYAFRCFLLRLGFIGQEYKEERKILLRNLSGSSAFKAGVRKEVSE